MKQCCRKLARGLGLQVLLSLCLILGVFSLSVLGSCMIHCSACSHVWQRQCYGRRRRGLRLVEMDNLRCLLGIRKMAKVPNARVRELCRVTKGVDERIDEGVLRWFGYAERMENDMIAKKVM